MWILILVMTMNGAEMSRSNDGQFKTRAECERMAQRKNNIVSGAMRYPMNAFYTCEKK